MLDTEAKKIVEAIGDPATFEQLAEECSELAHACLKMARVLRKENPTPVMSSEAQEAVIHEIADVALSIDTVMCGIASMGGKKGWDATDRWYNFKLNRWWNRLVDAGKMKETKSESGERKADHKCEQGRKPAGSKS